MLAFLPRVGSGCVSREIGMNDAELAALLQPRLKTSGPAPCLAYIEAAILVARDALSTRDACDAVAGVPRTVNSKIGKLAERVGRLLATPEFAVSLPSAPPPPMSPPPQPPPPAAEPIRWQHDQPPRLKEDLVSRAEQSMRYHVLSGLHGLAKVRSCRTLIRTAPGRSAVNKSLQGQRCGQKLCVSTKTSSAIVPIATACVQRMTVPVDSWPSVLHHSRRGLTRLER